MTKKQHQKEVQKSELNLTIYTSLRDGLNPSSICMNLGISKTRCQYHLSLLKSRKLIKKIGYGTWEVIGEYNQKEVQKSAVVTKYQLQKKEVRGHAFMWKIKIPKITNWHKRKEILEKNGIKVTEAGAFKTPRIIFKDRKIWLGKTHIIIYEPDSFFGINAVESKKYAVVHLLKLLEALERKLGTSLKTKEGYQFGVGRQHYALVNNSLAIQCNREGTQIKVSNKTGLWFLIDNSYNLDEAETVHKDTGVIDNRGVQTYFNSHKNTDFKVTPEWTMDAINKVTENQQMFAKNFESHVGAVQALAKGVEKLTDKIDELDKKRRV